MPCRFRELIALAGALVAGCGAAAPQARQDDGSILALSTPLDGSSTVLARVEADTLTPRSAGFDLGEYHGAWALSPDRRTIAFGTFARTGLRLIDPVSLRLVRDIPMPIAAIGVGWVDAERVAVLLQSGGVVLVDARRGRILRHWRLNYQLPCRGRLQAATPHGVVFVVTSRNGGRLRLLRIDPSGQFDVAALDRVRSPSSRRACGVPALAVDPAGRRAFVAGSHGPAAIVHLGSLRIRYRRERVLAGTCRRTRQRCTVRRSAEWSSPEVLALTGTERVARRERSLGLHLVDASTWSSRRVDRFTGQVGAMPDGSFLAFGGAGEGIRALASDGATRWTALGGVRVTGARATDRRVYVLDATGKATYVLDGASGRLLSSAAGRGRLDVLDGRDDAGDS